MSSRFATARARGADLEATTPGGLTAWNVAAQADAAPAIRMLIELGVDLEQRSRNGMNALDHAADAAAVDALRELAAAGVALDSPSQIVTQGHGYPIDEGSTPLAIAARAGHGDAVAALLDLGALVDARSALGQTALSHAVVTGQPPEMVAQLLAAGADPTVTIVCAERCGSGVYELAAWARRRGDTEVASLLETAVSAALDARDD